MQKEQRWIKIWDTRIALKNIKSYQIIGSWNYRPCLRIETYQRDCFDFDADSDSERDYIIKKFEELDMLFNIN